MFSYSSSGYLYKFHFELLENTHPYDDKLFVDSTQSIV